MGTINSDLAAKQKDPRMGNRNLSVLQTGDVTCAIAKVDVSGLEANDVIDIVKVPAGAVILKDQCKIVSDGASEALSVVVEPRLDKPDGQVRRYSGSTGVQAAGRHWTHINPGASGYTPENDVLPSDAWIFANVPTQDAPAGILYFIIVYAVVT